MKSRLIVGTLLAGALAISAAAQDNGSPQPPAIGQVMANLPSDAPRIATILATEPQEPVGPSDILREYERGMASISQRTYVELAQIAEAVRRGQISRERAEYFSQQSYQLGMMQFQLLDTLHQVLEDDIAKTAQRSETQSASSPDVPDALVKHLELTTPQVAAIQEQIVEERGRVRPLVEQLANSRQALIAATVQGRFEDRQVRDLAAEQSRILQQLIVSDTRLQTKVYKLLTAEQQRKIDKMREQVAVLVQRAITTR